MPWAVDESQPRAAFEKNKHVPLSSSSMKKYYDWRDQITSQNQDPATAASKLGNDYNYEALKGNLAGYYSIRVSQDHRVTFKIDPTLQIVEIVKIGGHYS